MTETPLTPDEALEERDITLALTPVQLVLAAIGVLLVIKIIRSLRR